MMAAFMARMDKKYAPVLRWGKATIHSRRGAFAVAAVRCGLHMAKDFYCYATFSVSYYAVCGVAPG